LYKEFLLNIGVHITIIKQLKNMTFEDKIIKIDQIYTASKSDIHGPAELKTILEQFTFNISEITEHLVYPENLPYGRKCAFRSANFEVIVMNWKPLQSSNIHDHGNSFGCVYSVSGKANNVLYNEKLEQIGSIPLINNAIAEVPKGIFHVIENNHDEYAVSLHFYAPPLSGMKVIDAADKSKNHIAKSDAGAWNPET
jgi:cysteine dioxygenase